MRIRCERGCKALTTVLAHVTHFIISIQQPHLWNIGLGLEDPCDPFQLKHYLTLCPDLSGHKDSVK